MCVNNFVFMCRAKDVLKPSRQQQQNLPKKMLNNPAFHCTKAVGHLPSYRRVSRVLNRLCGLARD